MGLWTKFLILAGFSDEVTMFGLLAKMSCYVYGSNIYLAKMLVMAISARHDEARNLSNQTQTANFGLRYTQGEMN